MILFALRYFESEVRLKVLDPTLVWPSLVVNSPKLDLEGL